MAMERKKRILLLVVILTFCSNGLAAAARITAQRETIKTYPFDDPDPVPIFARSGSWEQNARLYPYNFFNGFTEKAIEKEWTVVRLENPYIKLAVLPEVGGKIWGATEKSTNKDFIYTNHVLKFRQVGLRGPWTSGGVEFNFGIIGHAPSCATPVDYLLRRNDDGSVSCVVGTMDLPSRTPWRVTITLPKNKAFIETRTFWYNPTALDQSYYVWMNGAVKAGQSLQGILPGVAHIAHNFSVPEKPWPIDATGRDLSWYRNNNFGASKSYFTFGKYENFYGGYWHNRKFGFGHWALYDDMPGHKLWLWALSRQGAIWEQLLTDSDGQYVEPQAGRYLNQNDHGPFQPCSGDTWREIWFPYKQIGPLAGATPYGVLSVKRSTDSIYVGICALQVLSDELVVKVADKEIFRQRLHLQPMEVYRKNIPSQNTGILEVNIADKLHFTDNATADVLHRPFDFHNITGNATEEIFLRGLRYERSRRYSTALQSFLSCLQHDKTHLPALCHIASIYCRRGQYKTALSYADKALKLSMYDPDANYIYGIISRRRGDLTDALETLGWAARSMKYRSAAYCQMAEIFFLKGDCQLAIKYAGRALDYNKYNLNAYKVLAVSYRTLHKLRPATKALAAIREIDPLNHFARYELYLLHPDADHLAKFQGMIRNEFPRETYMELALYYQSLGLNTEAVRLLDFIKTSPVACYWLAYLLRNNDKDKSSTFLDQADSLSAERVFPYRTETIPVLQWAMQTSPDDWKPKYYLALIYWSRGRIDEARRLLDDCGNPEFFVLYITRAQINKPVNKNRALLDLEAAHKTAPRRWRTYHYLTNYYNELGMTKKSLALARQGASLFPHNMSIRLDLVRSLAANELWQEELDILEHSSILPFEGAHEVHDHFVKCQVKLALQNIKEGKYNAAIKYLDGSKRYPEKLGSGKPYDPDFRMQDFLAALCYDKLNLTAQALARRKAIYSYTLKHWDNRGKNRYFGALVLDYFGQHKKAEQLYGKAKPAPEILNIIKMMQGSANKP